MTPVFVLIMIMMAPNGASSMTTQEFTSEAYCTLAKQQIDQAIRGWNSMFTLCVRK